VRYQKVGDNIEYSIFMEADEKASNDLPSTTTKKFSSPLGTARPENTYPNQ
jgi:hypothetical protein